MGSLKVVEKVTAFITRSSKTGIELLVLEHPTAGTQIPSGTVELGEAPPETVLREVFEEAGLQIESQFRLIGHESETMPRDERVVLRTTKLFDEPNYDSSSEGFLLYRGEEVYIKNQVNDFLLIEVKPLHPTIEKEIGLQGVEGYVRRSILGNKLERYFYQAGTQNETKKSWQIPINGHRYKVMWIPLSSGTTINRWQQGWLEKYIEDLKEGVV